MTIAAVLASTSPIAILAVTHALVLGVVLACVVCVFD
jgi:hypothetical protein